MNAFNPEEHIGRLIVRARTLLSQRLQQEFSSHGIDITTEQWGLLTVLMEKEGISQKELADLSFKDNPTTTRMIKLLEKMDLINRQRNQEDGRAYQVFLTPKGRDVVDQASQRAIRVMQKAQNGLTKHEINEFHRITSAINSNLSE